MTYDLITVLKDYNKGVKVVAAFVLFDGEESYITQDRLSHKYVPIRSEKQATRFATIEKANNVLKSSIPKTIRSRYKVTLVAETENIAPLVRQNDSESSQHIDSAYQLQLEIRDMEIEKAPIDEMIDKFESINALFMDMASLGEDIEKVPQLLSYVDKKINDVEHYIEFGDNFNAYQGWLCFKILQNLLRQRRQYKNYQEACHRIRESKMTIESIENLITSLKGLNNQTYHARALPELFQQPHKRRTA
jgi:hypothetical protein